MITAIAISFVVGFALAAVVLITRDVRELRARKLAGQMAQAALLQEQRFAESIKREAHNLDDSVKHVIEAETDHVEQILPSNWRP